MLKAAESSNDLDRRAEVALRDLLGQLPALRVEKVHTERREEIDLLFRLTRTDQKQQLVLCEVKSVAQPRHVRDVLFRLRDHAARLGPQTIPLLIAPYLSPEVRALCSDQHVGYLDLEGNALLAFDTVYIAREVPSRPAAEHRALRSLFKPRAAQILRLLLRLPGRAWRVTELAQEANVSLGHVSNVRQALIDRDWAKVDEKGLFLSQPDALLDAWREAYEPPERERMRFYTALHGDRLDAAVKRAFDGPRIHSAYASFSAAAWLAPYTRTATRHFYADAVGLEKLQQTLDLSPAAKGENVEVRLLDDRGLFLDMIEPSPGVFCSSAVQTYLDIVQAGDRGQEAAQHLRLERLDWST
jgi:hypothetical protein